MRITSGEISPRSVADRMHEPLAVIHAHLSGCFCSKQSEKTKVQAINKAGTECKA